MKYYMLYNSPIGEITLEELNGKLCKLSFGNQHTADAEEARGVKAEQQEQRETELLRKTAKELDEYFDGKRKTFDVAVEPEKGTAFQRRVWKALTEIPYGQTVSYKDIAEKIGSPKAYRAVGGANNKNPIAIIVPCHRVVGANGALVGYASGLANKEKLLELERKCGIL